MASIKDLPVELLDIIFHLVDDADRAKWKRYPAPELPDAPSRALFPLNVAAVCPLWLNILKSDTAFWHCVVIDLADDPRPFLGTLTFHERMPNTNLNVFVFSSSPNISKDTENSRAHLVFTTLDAGITRYRRIAFQLVYQSSLPSAIDIIKRDLNAVELHLTCTVHDRHDEETTLESEDSQPTLFFPEYIETNLQKITLTGYDFVRICRVARL